MSPEYAGIVFTQLAAHADESEPQTRGAFHHFGEGARLVLLDRNGATRVLTGEFHSAADPSVSFDGKRILFAGKKTALDEWNIFEANADGSNIRQITKSLGNCRKPIYQSALFYLNDATPSYQITFVSDAANEANEADGTAAVNLYSMRFDGTGLRRLTYGISSSFDPFQMQDGRILYASWQRSKLDDGPQGRVELFAVHHDGTDVATFSGTQGKRFKRMACTTAQRKAVFVEADTLAQDGTGTLATLDLRRNLRSYKRLTNDEDGLFTTPSPVTDGSILVSTRPSDRRGTYSIFRMDVTTGRRQLVHADPKRHNVQAVVVAPRPEPDGHSSVVEDDQNWSKLYCLSTLITDVNREWIRPGMGKRIRVIEGMPRAAGATSATDSLSGMVQKRLLGETVIEEDGSFQVSVPPNTPMQLQILDEDGIAIRTSAWMWTKNKENRGCIGCHEDGELTPENVFPKALGKPAADLILPAHRRRTIDFARDIMPILKEKCVSCHRPQDSTIAVEGFPKAYAELLSGLDSNGRGRFVDPGRARTSRLIWSIYGKNTSRPWDRVVAGGQIKTMPPAGSAPLTDDEKRAIAEWIDLGAQFNPLPSHPANPNIGPTRGQQ